MPLCRAWGRGVMRPFSTFALGFILKLSLEIPNGVIGRRGGDVQPVSIVPLLHVLEHFPFSHANEARLGGCDVGNPSPDKAMITAILPARSFSPRVVSLRNEPSSIESIPHGWIGATVDL